ncbi:MAG: DUF2298 domain-containing protein, partial [Chloroflexi bacterium]|nr:DUF2298 domain-containing protein [Chloroflexota bacterium]
QGAVILKEHWEEGLPDLRKFEVRELPLYEVDNEQKFELLSERLAEADYIVFFSNRLYGTIPRLPDRYPVSSRYYNELFGGRLGYELVRFEATYPEFLGVGFVDETFGRSDVPVPGSLRGFSPSPITLDLGVADESFTVYDHPKVLIFENVRRLDSETIKGRIEGAEPNYPKKTFNFDENIGLLLSDADAAAQQSGGSWSDIVSPDGLAARFPVLGWLLVVEVFGLIAIPITFLVFRPLEDRGYLFSKAIGLLLVGLIVWLLASLQWLAFSRTSVVLAAVLLAMMSGILLVSRRAEIVGFVRSRWRLMLIGEVIFLAAFFAFLMIRMANPDLWHPFRGGEKPMDFAYLNAVVRSSYMPPYDPWFSGGYINYYYWGQFLTGTLIRATGIEPAVAFNLAVPLFFALTAGGAYTVVYNLAEGTRRRLALAGRRAGGSLGDIREEFFSGNPLQGQGENIPEIPVNDESDAISVPVKSLSDESDDISESKKLRKSPIVAGLVGVLFVTILGNLDGAIQVGHGIKRALFLNAPFGQFDFWRSSRMMPPDPPGNEITEFPYFTFLFGDLHAHLMALPFTLLALGLALAVVVRSKERRDGGSWGLESVARLGLLGVAVGSLRVINAWDFPTYLMVGGAAVLLAEYFANGGLSLAVLLRTGIKSIFIFAAGYIAFLPYHLSYETFYKSVESTTNTTVLWQFLAITGLFIFIIGSFFLAESRGLFFRGFKILIMRGLAFVRLLSANDAEAGPTGLRVSAG